MIRAACLLLVGLALSGCPGGVLDPDDASVDSLDGTSDGDTCVPCEHPPHVVDGRFTGWDGTPAGRHEWSCAEPLMGVYTTMYVDYADGRLMCLNDWHLNSGGPIDPECYNLFNFTVGSHVYELRVYGDQHTDVLRDGQPFATEVEGAAGFDVSPNVPTTPHSIFEFTVALPDKGKFELQASDPKGPSGCDSDDQLVEEPMIVKGYLTPAEAFAPTTTARGPTIAKASPGVVYAGDLLTIEGERFGVEGSVVFGPLEVATGLWSDRKIDVRVPFGLVGATLVSVATPAGTSDPVQLLIRCQPACGGRECGYDGCGGSCGSCPQYHVCEQGECICLPACGGRLCGDDGCGGSCGGCDGPQLACVGGACVCQPVCGGRDCGSDGCGGSCGACAGNEACATGHCVCVPDCSESVCGTDGCGGSCGACGAGTLCQGGQCVCAPQCTGKQCGDDSCGGSCGGCPAGQECAKNGVCTTP